MCIVIYLTSCSAQWLRRRHLFLAPFFSPLSFIRSSLSGEDEEDLEEVEREFPRVAEEEEGDDDEEQGGHRVVPPLDG